MTAISTTITHNIYYGAGQTYPSPLTITDTGAVTTSAIDKAAVEGFGGGTLINNGVILETGRAGDGVVVSGSGGTIVNTSLIQGVYSALVAQGVAYVTNSGTLLSTGTGNFTGVALDGGGTLDNSGSIVSHATVGAAASVFTGIVHNSGLIDGYAIGLSVQADPGTYGSVTNAASGLIETTGTTGTALSGRMLLTNRGTIAGKAYGVDLTGGSVDNTGRIAAKETSGHSATGLYMAGNGTLTNSGTISAYALQTGFYGPGGGNAFQATGDATLTNTTGTIIGSGFGVEGAAFSGSSATVTNGGLIQGYAQAIAIAGNGVIVNSGRLITDVPGFINYQFDVAIGGAGSFTNTAGGYVNHGVIINDATSPGASVTVVNAGTIVGGIVLNDHYFDLPHSQAGTGTIFLSGTVDGSPNNSIPIYFGGSAALLVLQHGYKIGGFAEAVAGAAYTNVVDLQGSAGAPVTVDFSPGSFRNFGTAAFATGAGNVGTLALAGSVDVPGTISGFTATGDVVDLKFISDTSGNATALLNPVTDQLTVTGDNGSVVLQLDKSEVYTGFHTTPDGTGTDVDFGLICFCRGTLIRTPRGDVPVESLKPDDLVTLADGRVEPIVWIGQGRVMAARGRRGAATPVIVRKGALAENVPDSDLRVTKGHALHIDNVLIPVEFLVNHRSIHWDDRAQEVSIYHIELPTHDILIANGAPAESYRDDGNRWLFQNANSAWDHAPAALFAPVLTGGPVVDAVWRRLLDRTGPRGRLPLTDDPDLHLMVDGTRLDPVQPMPGVYVFDLPGAPETARIVSRSAVPQELGLARDPRLLGVALRRIVVRSGPRFRIWDAADERLTDGFHLFELQTNMRWTSGDALLPTGLFAGMNSPVELVLTVASTAHYLEEGLQLLTA